MRFVLALALLFTALPALAEKQQAYLLSWTGRTPEGYCEAFPLNPSNYFAKAVGFEQDVIEKEFGLRRGTWGRVDCVNGGPAQIQETFLATPKVGKLVTEYFERNCFEREGFQRYCFKVRPVSYLQVDQWTSVVTKEVRRVPVLPIVTWKKSFDFDWKASQEFATSLDHRCYERLVANVSRGLGRAQGAALYRALRSGATEPFLDYHVFAVTTHGEKVLLTDNGWEFEAKGWCGSR
jgi:hypothetical protein